MSDQHSESLSMNAAANRRSSRSDGSVLFSAHLRATRKLLSLRFDYRTTDYQVVDGIHLLDEAADEIDRLRALVGRHMIALQQIERIAEHNASPITAQMAGLAGDALRGPNTQAQTRP